MQWDPAIEALTAERSLLINKEVRSLLGTGFKGDIFTILLTVTWCRLWCVCICVSFFRADKAYRMLPSRLRLATQPLPTTLPDLSGGALPVPAGDGQPAAARADVREL